MRFTSYKIALCLFISSSFFLLVLASPLPKFEEIITIEENIPDDDNEIKEVTVTIVGQEGNMDDGSPISSLFDLPSPLSEFEDILHSRPGFPLSSIMDKMEQAIMGMPGPFLGPFSGPKNKSPLSHSPSHMDHGKNDKHERPSKLFDDFDDVFEPLASEEALLSFIDDITDVIDSLDDEQDSNIEHDDVDTPNNSTASSVFEAIESLIEKPQNHLIDAIEKLVTAEVDETIIISGPTKPTSNAKEHQTTSLPNKILTVVCHPLMVSAMLFSSALSAFVWIKYGRKKQRKPYYSHVPNTEDEETANLINE